MPYPMHYLADYSELSVVIPCYNENIETLRKLEVQLIELGIEVLIVDDGSKIPYPTREDLIHKNNIGYGQALMTGISKASRPYIMTLDGDGQHRLEDVRNLYLVWKILGADMIIGSRRLAYEKKLRIWGRKVLNFIASMFTGIYMQDLNSGMRIFKKDIAIGYFPILCKTFSFTTSITMSYMCDDYRVEWFPIHIKERAHGLSHVKVVRDGIITLYHILKIGIALRTRRIREWIRNSIKN